MQRAVVSIGVKKTGGLPELQAAVDSATEFAKWAREFQKVPASRVKLITDAKGPVSRDRIFDTVEKIVKLGFVEQLIVYFSGHGINTGLFEQWLLSRAPDDPAAAVNVKGSEFGARFCGIEHVVFISDACRTAADNIQAQRVVGSDIFPNPAPGGTEKAVDQFFATQVGNPAFEVQTIEESVKRYRAAYSTVLIRALRGEVASLVEVEAQAGLVRPRRLKHHLNTEVPAFFSTLNLGVASQPAARIESEPDAWLAELPAPAVAAEAAAVTAKRRAGSPRRQSTLTGDEVLPAVRGSGSEVPLTFEREVSNALFGVLEPTTVPRKRRGVARVVKSGPPSAIGRRYTELVSVSLASFGPEYLPSTCGIKMRGALADSAEAISVSAIQAKGIAGDARIGPRRDVIDVSLPKTCRGANVFVRLVDGSAVIAPVFRDFITGLSFDADGHLEDVWCEPSANTQLAREYRSNADRIRQIRAVVAASSALGVFRLDEVEVGQALLGYLRSVKALDPALAVYAAYAFHDRRMRTHIVDMQKHLDRQLKVRVFDVAMLAFAIGRTTGNEGPEEMYPCVPMLTQGWSLLTSLGITLPGDLGSLQGELRPSLCTHFTSAAADRVRTALRSGRTA